MDIRRMPQSRNVNFIKYIAALFVIISHSFVISTDDLSPVTELLNRKIAFGSIGVAIFFFFSGLLVTQSMLHKRTATAYFKARIYRIFPPLVVVVLVTIFVLGTIVTELPKIEYLLSIGTYKYLLNIVLIRQHYLPGVFESNPYPAAVNGSLWTLVFEFACYILTYIVYRLNLLKRGRILVTIPLVMLGVSAIWLICGKFGIDFGYLATIIRPCICYYVGMLSFFYYEYIINIKVFALAAIMTVIGLANNSMYIFPIIVLPVLLLNLGWSESCFSINSSMADLGKYSYGIYLVAFPIQQLLVYLLGEMNPFCNSLLTIVLSTVLGKLIHDYIEVPISRKI